MKRRAFITLLGGAAVAWPVAARGQQPERMRRLGFLVAARENDPQVQIRLEAFRRGLQVLGWVEGRNIHFDYRHSGSSAERLHNFAAEIVRSRPDVIFAGNSTALMALRQVTNTLPIVFAQVSDPVALGVVTSLARPGGNITGFANYEREISTKWVEVLREIAPHATHIGIIYDPLNVAQEYLPHLESASASAVRLEPFAVRSQSELEDAMERIGAEPNSALIVLAGPIAAVHRDLIILLSIKYRLPLVYPYRHFTAAGGLMSYGPDVIDEYRRAASYVHRILKGEYPADLPVQFPTKYELVINLNTAKALGLSVPPMLLARADEVIE